MKDKILVFILGLLVGCVITAGGFLIYQNTTNSNSTMPDGEREMGEMQEMGEKPDDMPDGEGGGPGGDGETPPDMPGNTTSGDAESNS